MNPPFVELVGTGKHVPTNILTNADFEKMVDTSDEWILERTGILQQILDAVLKAVKSTGDLVVATVTGGIVTNILAADQFLAIALPGRLFCKTYDDFNLSRENLSRTLEDSATMTSALIPWNTCGAYMAATLGVATFEYAPYAIFNIMCPLIAIAFGYLAFQQKAAVTPAA